MGLHLSHDLTAVGEPSKRLYQGVRWSRPSDEGTSFAQQSNSVSAWNSIHEAKDVGALAVRLLSILLVAVLVGLVAFVAVDIWLPPNLKDRAQRAGEADNASIRGYGDIRTYRDARLEEVPKDVRNWAPATNSNGLDFLMISGGGSAGAFSVGVLSAWSAAGTRPQFDVVTGVSTGALIAPYAFLGSAYDDALVHIFTSGVAEELVATKFPVGLLGSSLLKSTRLRQMVEELRHTESPAADCSRTSQRPTPSRSHNQPRHSTWSGVEHGRHRQQRPPGRAEAVSGCSDSIGEYPRRLSGGHDQSRIRRAPLPGNAF